MTSACRYQMFFDYLFEHVLVQNVSFEGIIRLYLVEKYLDNKTNLETAHSQL